MEGSVRDRARDQGGEGDRAARAPVAASSGAPASALQEPGAQRPSRGARPLELVARAALVLLGAAALGACAKAPPPAALQGGAGEAARAISARAVEQRAAWVWPEGGGAGEAQPVVPRGFGSMSARVPGTEAVVSGVRLVAHHVRVDVRDGLARTTIEEAFQNDTGTVLEGRYAFPLPPDASISRLALYVGDELVEGEVVERPRAARIFKSIVDDTVRPRDPALLEWVSASEFSLKIFPIPAKGRRKVVLAYDQPLAEVDSAALRYVYPMSLGDDRATRIDDFSINVMLSDSGSRISGIDTPGYSATIRSEERSATVSYAAHAFTPASDFVVGYSREAGREATVATCPPAAGERAAGGAEPPGYFAVRVRADLPEGAPAPAPRRDRAIVIDVSQSQSKDTVLAEARLATSVIRSLAPGERFVVLACDSACASYPEDGLAPAGGPEERAAEEWLAQRAPRGSSDLGGAIAAAAKRLDAGGGQVVYIGDGAPTSGELSVATLAARLSPALKGRSVDLRLLGLGRTVDEVVFTGLARAVGATYERVATGEPLARRSLEITRGLRAPVIRDPQLVLPAGLHDVYPRALPNLRAGQEIVVTGRVLSGALREAAAPRAGDVVPAAHAEPAAAPAGGAPRPSLLLTGTIGDAPVTIEKPIRWASGEEARNPLVPRLWARAKIADLERAGDPAAEKEALRLSKDHHVMARGTALLVLENDRMFAEFGIPRTGRPGAPAANAAPAAPRAPALAGPASPPAAEFGMLGLLDQGAAAPWGRDGSLGADPPSAKGGMWGHDIGDSFGAGGLGLTGIGEGGGGRGEGIGLGSIGTIGRAAGVGTGQGFGSGKGRLGGSHRTNPPKVRMGASSVSGRLPPEVIQRIVRQNFGRFRLCYERGLANNPNLQGRVAVRFVIGRDGEVSNVGNGGSDMPDGGVVSCVVGAFQGLRFPQPEGGIVTVTYPILFSPSDSSWPSAPASRPSWSPPRPFGFGVPVAPSAIHRAPPAAPADDPALDRLRAAAAAPDATRKKHESLVRKLLVAGRVDEALAAATRFAELDPDLDAARELLAFAAAASGQADAALAAVDALSETGARDASRHARAARAFEAAGDERRACAHWRSLADLAPRDEAALYQSLRCRARVLGDRDAAQSEARSAPQTPSIVNLAAALQAGAAPAFDPTTAPAGQLEAKVACAAEGDACPSIAIIGPTGNVVSPWTPGASRADGRSIALSGLSNGTYRVVISRADPAVRAEVELRALGAKKTFPVDRAGAYTLAMTTVSGVD